MDLATLGRIFAPMWSSDNRVPFGVQSLAELGERQPNGFENAAAKSLSGVGSFAGQSLSELGKLPQRAFESSETMRRGDGYDPGPVLEAAMLPMAGTAFSAPAGALGAGPVRSSTRSGFAELEAARHGAEQKYLKETLPPPTPTMEKLRNRIKGLSEAEALDSDSVWYLARHLHEQGGSGASFSKSFAAAAETLIGRPLTASEISKAMIDGASVGIGK